MTSQKLAGVVKAHWPLAVIAIAVAVLAFAAGALASNRGAADEQTPAAATSNPTAAPTPTVPPELYYTPTNEEWERARQERIEREKRRGVSGNDDKKDGLGSKYTPRSPVPRSTAQARAWAAPEGRALYFVSNDKVIFLPEGVKRIRWIPSVSCGRICPAAPITVLQRGEATVSLDAYGDVIPGLFETGDSDAFSFLREEQE